MGVKANRNKTRLLIVCLSMILSFSIIVGALFYWQIISAESLQRKALGQWTGSTALSASRGTIYDSTGEALAISTQSKSLNSKPKKISKSIHSAEEITTLLVSILGEDYSYETIYKRIKYVPNESATEYVVARHLNDEQIATIESLNIDGLYLVDDVKRYYPKGATLAQVLGSVTEDGIGSEGLELKYDKQLRGVSGRITSSTDVSNGVIPGSEKRYVDASNGVNIKLTINYAMQSFAESILNKCITENGAKKAKCIIMEPSTAKILAMVNLPDYNINTATKSEKKEKIRNGCVLDTYEPGSTFKMFTLSTALNENKVNTSSQFNCTGSLTVDGEKISCWRTVPHGNQTLEEALCNSCNPAFMTMGLSVGQSKLYEYLYNFGFNTTTGIDFSSDQAGIMLAPKYVKNTDLARISFGQSIAVTPLQLITAACAVINGGTLYQPYFVDSYIDNSGNVLTQNEPIKVRDVISKETSDTMRNLLVSVVEKGGGKNAAVEGYKIGGKTGTAQIYEDGVIVRGSHIGSFFGFAPAENPKVAILVIVEEATVYNDYGSNTAAPYAGQILSRVLQYLQVKQSADTGETVVVPNVVGMSDTKAGQTIKDSGLLMEIDGSGEIVSQTPAAGTEVKKYSIIKVKGNTAADTTVSYGID